MSSREELGARVRGYIVCEDCNTCATRPVPGERKGSCGAISLEALTALLAENKEQEAMIEWLAARLVAGETSFSNKDTLADSRAYYIEAARNAVREENPDA